MNNYKDMSWWNYFRTVGTHYYYIDRSVVSLPANLPMPPTDDFSSLFYNCWRLQDITALSSWDTSNVTDMSYMFLGCLSLRDISALANWNVSNVRNMTHLFGEAFRYRISPL